ncbi:nucleotidyltransferase domain-containing protein [Spirochaetota bacterium]
MKILSELQKKGILISENDILLLVEKYNIKELSIFGSSLRNDFNDKSDIDFLIEFNDSQNISLFDLIDIQEYLENITKRSVDLVEPDSLKNPYRRASILANKEIIYAS